MNTRFQFMLRSLRSKLWIKPLGYALLAVGLVFAAHLVDRFTFGWSVPEITQLTIEKLLNVISASMLGVATFSVASMVSAYASASQSATPRVFTLIVADSMSQKALSTFIAAFIFSVVATVALESEYYGSSGRFLLFILTILVVAWVVVMFVRWVDHIARLGRMHNTIERVEEATVEALQAWGPSRALGGAPSDVEPQDGTPQDGKPMFTAAVGYVQHLDVHALHEYGESIGARFHITTPPGSFVSPSRPLLHYAWDGKAGELDKDAIEGFFVLSNTRTFTQDPRFGLIALAEIASRALSPGVNDPGTAIEVVGRFVRILTEWKLQVLDDLKTKADNEVNTRVRMAPLSYDDMIDDAFHAIARDGAGTVEVGIWIQKGLSAIAELHHEGLTEAATRQAKLALHRAREGLPFAHDVQRLDEVAASLWDEK